jgi:nicotinate-nucleotide pyrophosphorylase (carboxylating)
LISRIDEHLREAVLEDLGFGDITTDAVVSEGQIARAVIICKEKGLLAGLKEVAALFSSFECKVKILAKDGEPVAPGTKILLISGPARNILRVERVALNVLTRMSGIATETHRLVELVTHVKRGVRVAATRKSPPGMAYLDKRAVMLGGGDTHRFRLDDAVLIKDNHIALAGSVSRAVRKVRAKISFIKKIEVEVSNVSDAMEAVAAGADILLVDNAPPNIVRRVVEALKQNGMRGKVLVEASGRVTSRNITDYARSGVDVVSVGSLTHSPTALDMSLEIVTKGRLG